MEGGNAWGRCVPGLNAVLCQEGEQGEKKGGKCAQRGELGTGMHTAGADDGLRADADADADEREILAYAAAAFDPAGSTLGLWVAWALLHPALRASESVRLKVLAPIFVTLPFLSPLSPLRSHSRPVHHLRYAPALGTQRKCFNSLDIT